MRKYNPSPAELNEKLDLTIRLFEKLLYASQRKKRKYPRRYKKRRKQQPVSQLPFTMLEKVITGQLMLLEKSVTFLVEKVLDNLAGRLHSK